jgi:hypothetical protein
LNEPRNEPSRRDILKCSVAGAAVVVASGGCASVCGKNVRQPQNADFYKADGSFCPDSARKAYFGMMEAFGYRIADVLKTDEFWVCDFLQRDYENLGMGGIFWMNASGKYGESGARAYSGPFKDKLFGYLGHEIYLLPGQMLPEHRHIGGNEEYGPKMESWHVRYGSVQFFGEYKGDGDEKSISDMPRNERPWGYGEAWFKSKYVAERSEASGKLYTLVDPESWHFQRAGKQGAIVTEYATYHNHVEFSKPGMEFACSKAAKA